jgi:hypothetical protein
MFTSHIYFALYHKAKSEKELSSLKLKLQHMEESTATSETSNPDLAEIEENRAKLSQAEEREAELNNKLKQMAVEMESIKNQFSMASRVSEENVITLNKEIETHLLEIDSLRKQVEVNDTIKASSNESSEKFAHTIQK